MASEAVCKLAYLCLQITRQGQASYSHVHEIIEGLKRRGWEVTLYEPSHSRITSETSPWRRLLEFIRVQFHLIRRFDKYNAIYVRGHFAAFPTSLFAKLRRLPIIHEINGPYEDLFIAWPFTRRFSPLFIWLARVQMSWASVVITVTDQLGGWCKREAGHERVYVVPNGANTEVFCPEASTFLPLPAQYAIFFGALARWQGLDTILKAVQNDNWPEKVYLVIVGDGAMRREVEDATAKNSHIVYLGILPQRELAGVVAHALFGLICKSNLGGRGETGLSPLKLYETVASGVPVIVTDFPGMSDFVRTHGCGLVVPPDDPGAVIEAALKISASDGLARRMGSSGRLAICCEHSWDHRAADTHKIIHRLVFKGQDLV
jgi:glycosyltransferase involved in cell wall biosynthesis